MVIVGCGRVGAGLAGSLAAAGEVVTMTDKEPKAFERLGGWPGRPTGCRG
jgi:Trk K+ transport system NAD-binding subunit